MNIGLDSRATASFLESGRTIADAGQAAAIVAGFGSIAGHAALPRLLFASSLVCWLAESWFAARVRIDAALFQHLAEQPEESWRRVDELVNSVSHRRAREHRNVEDRRRGALTLWRGQGIALALQFVILISAVFLETARPL
jgi:hypothetical protein